MYKKNIFSVILAVLLSVSLLSVNCFAFTFDGENRSIKDIYSDWFKSTRDFVSGNSSFEEWRNDNIRFQTDIIGSNLFPGTETELDRYISELEDKLRTAVEGTDNKVDDSVLNIYDKTLEALGIFDFRSQFEDWYQDKYGKEYGKHENAFFDTTGYNYYIFSHSTGYEYKLFFTYSGDPIKVSETSYGFKYFLGSQLGTITYRSYRRTQYSNGDWGDWEGGKEYTGSVGSKYYLNALEASGSSAIVDSTNLPLQYGDDITGGDPVTDWDSELGGELVAPSITLPEIGDLLTDLDEDLKNSDPDTDNPYKGIELKITQLINKMHNDFSKVIDILKKILDKLTEFFNKFIDIFDNFFEKLGEFFQSIFVPSDDYFNNSIMDIKTEFDEVFSFAGDLRLIIDTCIKAYKNGGTNPPDITIDIDGALKSYKLDFSIFNDSVELVRSVLCAVVYFSFAWNTYKRIPLYISGGGE